MGDKSSLEIDWGDTIKVIILPITIFTILGVVFLSIGLWLIETQCANNEILKDVTAKGPLLCQMVVKSPPWTQLAALAAAPSLLLTWGWRTFYRRRETLSAAYEKADRELKENMSAQILKLDHLDTVILCRVYNEIKGPNRQHRSRFLDKYGVNKVVELEAMKQHLIHGFKDLRRLVRDVREEREKRKESLHVFRNVDGEPVDINTKIADALETINRLPKIE